MRQRSVLAPGSRRDSHPPRHCGCVSHGGLVITGVTDPGSGLLPHSDSRPRSRRPRLQCYERTVENNPDDRAAYNELGVLYKDLMEPTDHKKAALYFGKLVDLELEANSGNVESESALKACLFLGHFYADHDDLASASRYNSILMKYGGKYKEKGKDLQVKIQTLGHA